MTQPPRPPLTDEVMAALGQVHRTPVLEVPPIPAGHVQYFVAVGESQQSGTAPKSVVVEILRAAADQLAATPPKEHS